MIPLLQHDVSIHLFLKTTTNRKAQTYQTHPNHGFIELGPGIVFDQKNGFLERWQGIQTIWQSVDLV